jgi:hypothetical protein
VSLAGEAKVWEKLIYTLKNPVKDGLVPRLSQWPGAKSDPQGYGQTTTIERPRYYFVADGSMPEKVDLELTVPPNIGGYTAESFGEEVARKLAAEENEIIADFKAVGRSFLGRKKVMAQSPFSCPFSQPERSGTCARDACADKHAFEALKEREKTFQTTYRECWQRYQAGERDILWPPGTYWMVRHAGYQAGQPDEYLSTV